MSRAGKVSLRELMGKSGGKASLDHLPELLGDGMPKLPRNLVGKNRLLNALRNRFGGSYRNLPGVSDMIKQFDDDIKFEHKIKSMRKVKVR